MAGTSRLNFLLNWRFMVGVERILKIQVYLSALLGLMPVLPFLDLWVQLILGGGFLLGVLGDRSGHYLLSNRLATVLSVTFFVLFCVQVSFANLVPPLIDLLCLLMAVRLASDKSARHMLQLFLLATIILAASSMLTLDLAYLFYLVLIVLLVTSGLVLLSFYTADPQLRFGRQQWLLLLKTVILLPVGSLLLMMVLFVLLPRTQTPLWNFLNPQPNAVIGMTDQVQPGSVAELSESTEIAFRAESERLPVDALYWRGIVLNRLEGRIWKRMLNVADEILLPDPGSEINLAVYSGPKADQYLVTLDRPIDVVQVRNIKSADGVVRGRFRDSRKLSYEVRAQLAARSQQTGDVAEYLRLPEHLSDRLRKVGNNIKQGKDYPAKLALLEGFFLQQQLSYATTKLPKTESPVDTFLFDSRRGYCEYFASSFAILLRLAGVPTRLVGGYLGGDYNQIGGYYLVGEDAAHVWVEALDDQGVWQRIDPSQLAVNAEQAFSASSTQVSTTFRELADALLHNWSRLVLNYDLSHQFRLLRQVAHQVRELKDFESRSLVKLLWVLPPMVLVGLAYFWRQRQNRSERLLLRYRRLLAKAAGLESLPVAVGLFELAKCTGEPLCLEFADIYGGAVYRDKALDEEEYRKLRGIISRISEKLPAIEVALPTVLGDNDSP